MEEGVGEPLLLLHGEPTWSYLYRKMIGPLSGVARVIAPDYIGFGRSDKVEDGEWYSYDRHVESIHQLIDMLDLSQITLVVQDWGGPIGLRVAMEDPDAFARLVILNTGLTRPGPKWPTPAFLAWLEFAESNPDLPVSMLIQGATFNEVPDDVLAAYEAPFPTVGSKAGAAVFPSLIPIDATSPGATEMLDTADALERWTKPTLVAFSDSDPLFPQGAGERMAGRIPGARFVGIAEASHFLQEDQGEKIAEHIIEFLKNT